MTGAPSPVAPVVAVGFDGSPGARRALEWAADECELRRAVLLVLHVDLWAPAALTLPGLREEVAVEEALLDEGMGMVERGHPSLRIVGRRVPPPAGESLVEASRGASLLVVGSRGLGHVRQAVLGSVSRYCVDHAHCPVVVVRGEAALVGDGAARAQRPGDAAAVGTSSPSER